jgi:hypothetical protein
VCLCRHGFPGQGLVKEETKGKKDEQRKNMAKSEARPYLQERERERERERKRVASKASE